MKFDIITKKHGTFTVILSYSPTPDDNILARFAAVIDSFDSLDEAKVEKALYDSTRVSGGAGLRLTFSLTRREINTL